MLPPPLTAVSVSGREIGRTIASGVQWGIALGVVRARTRPNQITQQADHLGGQISQIEINDLENHTFFARIHIRRDGEVIKVDSRPSDAIALGVASNVPVYVAEHVLIRLDDMIQTIRRHPAFVLQRAERHDDHYLGLIKYVQANRA
mgnify:CR=1 FL=1